MDSYGYPVSERNGDEGEYEEHHSSYYSSSKVLFEAQQKKNID
jgi:hypothetical protein